MCGLREVGVPAHRDAFKTGLAAQSDYLVQRLGSVFVRGTVAATIDQIEGFGGIGQRNQQGVIAPGAVVRDVDALLAFSIGADESAVDVDNRFGEEAGGLLRPDPQSRLIDCVHQRDDIMLGEPATEVPLCGWVGETLSAQGIEIDRVVASQLDVFNRLPTGHDVEDHVQDVVGFMIGTMALEEMEVVVDIGDQADSARQQQHGTDSPGIEPLDAIGEFIVDVASGSHRLFAFQPRSILDAV
jgi:hypothetical protein